MEKVGRTVLAALLALSTLAACDPPPPPVTTLPSRAYTEAALSLAPPPAGRARVFVFNGTRSDRGRLVMRTTPSDIYVNDVKIGSVDRMQVMVFDVAPGRYALLWKSYGRSYALLEKPVTNEQALTGGTNLLLKADLEGMQYVMNPVDGGAYMTPDRRIPPDFEIVRPLACPSTICLP